MRRTRATVGLVAVAAVAAVALVAALSDSGASTPGRASGPFAWLRPAAQPVGWKLARTPGGATLSYPPAWTPIKTDPGTASVALLGRGGRIEAYLNATPRSGAETLSNWRQFRPEHNREEGAREVHLLAATSGASFRPGRGSCVIDTYTTSTATYREIACLVSSTRSTDVVVAAAPTARFKAEAPELERAISSFTA